jgi:hypothetical protein
MPFKGGRGGGKLSRAKRVAYFKHLDAHPNRARYLAGFQRPSEPTAKAVWSTLARALKLKLGDLLLAPAIRLPGDELRAKQALVVAVDAALTAGEQGRMLTINTIFDALARHWSDHYLKAIEEGPATISYDMKASTVRASWRDLLRNGVQLDALWPKIREGCPGLYKTHRIQGRGRARGRAVELASSNSSRLTKFLRAAEADPEYRRRHHDVHPRLLLANEPLPRRNLAGHVAGEWAYNVATPGRRSLKVIERLETARFYLNVRAFMKEADRLEQRAKDCRDSRIREYGRLGKRRKSTGRRPAETRARLRTLWNAENTARAHFAQVKSIRERLQELEAVSRTGTSRLSPGTTRLSTGAISPPTSGP